MISKLKQKIILAWLVVAGAAAHGQDTNVNTNANANTNASAPLATDFRSFDLIIKRNIFDPTRSGSRPSRVITRPPRIDSFTLVGTMSSEQGQYAFFDGSSSDYRKTLKPAEKIAGYKIAQIAPDHILLAAASNQTINLPVGTRMRRQDGGVWKKTGGFEAEAAPESTPSATPAADSAGTPALSGGESDAMKRLMLKRLSEK
jgi:hypothetical protein